MLACNYVAFQCQSESWLSAVTATVVVVVVAVECQFRYHFTGVSAVPLPLAVLLPLPPQLLVTFWSTFVSALQLQLISHGCHGVVELVNQARKLPLYG